MSNPRGKLLAIKPAFSNSGGNILQGSNPAPRTFTGNDESFETPSFGNLIEPAQRAVRGGNFGASRGSRGGGQIGYLEENTGVGFQAPNNPGVFSGSNDGRGGSRGGRQFGSAAIGYTGEKVGAGFQEANNPGDVRGGSRGGRGAAQIGYTEAGAGFQGANNPVAYNSSSGGRGGRGGSQNNAPTEQKFEVKQEQAAPQFGNYSRGGGATRGRGGNVQSARVNETSAGYQENQPPVDSSVREARFGGRGGQGGSRIEPQMAIEAANAAQGTGDVQGTVQTIARGGSARGGKSRGGAPAFNFGSRSDDYYETTPTEYPRILPLQNADVKDDNAAKQFSNHLADITKPAMNNNIAANDQMSTDTQKELTCLIADMSAVMSRMTKLAQKLCR
ncbi:hypothetical protein Ddc_09397 [Ditylenchus destructor]|nr:hypothetical protein Ddc_09397 [Ditylenchus destructor]